MDPYTILTALFISSFLAATLLPGGSEVALYAAFSLHPELRWPALAVATVGNTLGGLSSYALGRLIPENKSLRGVETVRRYGAPALLLSWVPIVGDPLCVAAGWLRVNAWRSALCIGAGKFARYVAVLALAQA
jgi:membrane protein YqaA with SNARE-associated domain